MFAKCAQRVERAPARRILLINASAARLRDCARRGPRALPVSSRARENLATVINYVSRATRRSHIYTGGRSPSAFTERGGENDRAAAVTLRAKFAPLARISSYPFDVSRVACNVGMCIVEGTLLRESSVICRETSRSVVVRG